MFVKFELNVLMDFIIYFEDFYWFIGWIFYIFKEFIIINIIDLRESDEVKYYLEIWYVNFENYIGYNIYFIVKGNKN